MADRTQTFNEATLISLLHDLETLAKAARSVKEKLLKVFPVKYGSDLWWEKETAKSLKEYEDGKYKSFTSVENLIKDLNS